MIPNFQKEILLAILKISKLAKSVLDILPPADHNFIVPSKEAELAKYMGNAF